jgi:hypothetical protein
MHILHDLNCCAWSAGCHAFMSQDRAFNDRRYYIGNSKLHSLGWGERTTWEEGLRKTIDWCVMDCRPLCAAMFVESHAVCAAVSCCCRDSWRMLRMVCVIVSVCFASAWHSCQRTTWEEGLRKTIDWCSCVLCG